MFFPIATNSPLVDARGSRTPIILPSQGSAIPLGDAPMVPDARLELATNIAYEAIALPAELIRHGSPYPSRTDLLWM